MIFSMKDYKKNTKEFSLEEPFDFIFYRPLAYLLVKLTYKLPLSPDMFSLFALCSSFTGGYFISRGTVEGFLYGGLAILIFGIFDCCDGMLSRMKKNGSTYGNLVDMFVDFLSSIAFYTGTFLGLKKSLINVETNFYYMVWPAAIFLLIHVGIYNFYKKQFLFYRDGNPDGRKREIDYYKRELEKLKKEKTQYFNQVLLLLFLTFTSQQAREDKKVEYHKEYYAVYNKKILPFWGIISGSTHLSILGLSLIFNAIDIYIYFSLIFANLWLLFTYMIQIGVNNKLKREQA